MTNLIERPVLAQGEDFFYMKQLIKQLEEGAQRLIVLKANNGHAVSRTASVEIKQDNEGREYFVILYSAWQDHQQRLNGINQTQAIEALLAHLGSDIAPVPLSA